MTKISVSQSYIKNLKLNTEKLDKLKAELPNAIANRERDMSIEITNLTSNSIDLQHKTKLIIDLNSKFLKVLMKIHHLN